MSARAWMCLVLLCGCGAGAGSQDRPDLAGENGGGGDGGGGGGDGGGDGGGAAGDMASGPLRGGWVYLQSSSQVINAMTYSSSFASASFWQVTGALPPSTCTVTHSGTCTLTRCPPAGDAGTAPVTQAPDAGTLTIKGGARTVTLSPDANGAYGNDVDNMNALYAGGETLTISASGGSAPAFSGTLTAPAKAQVLSPTMPAAGASLPIARASGFPLSWSGGSNGEVTVGVYAQGGGAWVTCSFPASAGSGSVPSSLLSQLPAGAGTFNATLRASRTLDAQGWSVDLWAYQTISGSAGSGFAGLAALQ